MRVQTTGSATALKIRYEKRTGKKIYLEKTIATIKWFSKIILILYVSLSFKIFWLSS